MKKTIYFLVVFILCFGVFLRLKNNALEPYPAILFPIGASVLNVNHKVLTFSEIKILGLKNGTFKEIDDDIDERTMKILRLSSSYDFGLSSRKKSFTLKKSEFSKLKFTRLEDVTGKDKKEVKKWLRKIYKNHGYSDSILKIQKLKVSFNRETKTKIREKTIDEQIFKLY